MDDMELSGNYIMIRRYTAEEKAAFVKVHKAEWETVGNQIAQLRNKLRVTKAALAREAGICVKTLTKLENGKYIRRFRTVSKSCFNALAKKFYKANPEIKSLIDTLELQ